MQKYITTSYCRWWWVGVLAFAFQMGYSQDDTKGLLGHYTFCDCTAKDNSSNHQDGVVTGSPACTKGSRDYGLLFNQRPGGNNGCGQAGGEYITLPATGAIWSEGFTVCAWIRFDEIKNFERIFDFSNGNGESGGMPVWFGREGNSNNLTLESWINSNGSQARSTGRLVAVNAITNGAIEYYCATFSGNTMRIYVNGELVAQKQGNPVLNVSRTNNYIGHSAWCGNDPDFKGFMDEVRIYTRALGPGEIQDLYQLTNINDFTFSPVCYTNDAAFEVSRESQVDSVSWNFGDAASGTNNYAAGFNAFHQFTDTGNYMVRAIAYKYCLNDTVIKTVHVGPYGGFLGPGFSVCEKNPQTLQPGIPATAFRWQDGSTGSSYLVSRPGDYWLEATVNGCTYRDSVQVTSGTIHSEISQVICAGKQYAGHTAPGNYTDTLTAVNGCDSIRLLHLMVLPVSAKTLTATICSGESYLGYSITGTYRDTLTAANGCDSIRTVQLTVLPKITSTVSVTICRGDQYFGHTVAGNYVDTLTAARDCDSIRVLHLNVLDRPQPVMPADSVICRGNLLVLSPGVFDSYLWQDGSTANQYTVSRAGIYRVTVTNSCGSGSVSSTVIMDSCRFVFPSAFTPDHNGNNDVFRVLGAGGILQYHLVVYNRWGQKLFETNDFQKGWDGKDNSMPAATGVYAWFASIKTANGMISRKGTVVLIR